MKSKDVKIGLRVKTEDGFGVIVLSSNCTPTNFITVELDKPIYFGYCNKWDSFVDYPLRNVEIA